MMITVEPVKVLTHTCEPIGELKILWVFAGLSQKICNRTHKPVIPHWNINPYQSGKKSKDFCGRGHRIRNFFAMN